MARILITGARLLLTIDFLRQMARAGHRVWLADSARFPAAAFSRYSEGYIRTPPPRTDPEGFVTALAAAMKEKKIDLLIPIYEETFYISKYRHAFDNPDAVFCADFDTLDRLHNKFSFATTLTHPDVQAPETYLLKTPEDIEQFVDRSNEFVFKPAYSRFGTRILVRPKPHEARTVKPQPDDPWIVQRFIEGTEFCSYNVAKNGKLVAHAAYQPLYRLKNSAGFYFRPSHDSRMMSFAKDIVAQHDFTGQISFDYIQQPDGKIYLLECNPRAISGVHLFSDHPEFPGVFLGQAKGAITPDSDQSYMLSTAMIFVALPKMLGRRRLFFRDFMLARDALFRANDILPTLAQLLMFGEFFLQHLKQGIPMKDAACRDISWDGEPILQRVENSKTLHRSGAKEWA